MALAQNTTQIASSGLFGQLAHYKAEFDHWRETRRVYRNTLTELNRLGDRELADLGLNRSQLRSIAKEAAATV